MKNLFSLGFLCLYFLSSAQISNITITEKQTNPFWSQFLIEEIGESVEMKWPVKSQESSSLKINVNHPNVGVVFSLSDISMMKYTNDIVRLELVINGKYQGANIHPRIYGVLVKTVRPSLQHMECREIRNMEGIVYI